MRKGKQALALFVVVISICFCASAAVAQEAAEKAVEVDISGFEPLPESPSIPEDNPMTPAKIQLGKQLFFDPRLSINGSISCQSCHNVMLSGTTNLPIPFGVFGKVTGDRQDPTVWNAAFKPVQFWDGRAPSLEEQAKGPLFNQLEMGINEEILVNRIKSIPGYASQFQAVFGGPNPVTVDNIVKAIAAYERTLITPNSPFDRFLRGDKDAISPAAKRGMELVRSVGCTACHSGPNFSGPIAPMGEGFYKRFPMYTEGRYVADYSLRLDLGRFLVTRIDSDKYMWVVQTWRNIELTAPYFHNGSVPDLRTAVLVMAKTELNADLTDDQVSDIVAFMKTLTGQFPEQSLPRLPETSGTTLLMEYGAMPAR